jgi:hypothetical protein
MDNFNEQKVYALYTIGKLLKKKSYSTDGVKVFLFLKEYCKLSYNLFLIVALLVYFLLMFIKKKLKDPL